MNLNTVTAVRHPESAAEIAQWHDGDAWLAGGTWLFSEPQPATRHADRPGAARLAGARGVGRRARDRRDLPHRRALSFRGAEAMDRRAAVPGVLRCPARLVQDLERGHGRRQHLHVASRRGDDLAGGGARGTLHALAARRGAAGGCRRRFRHRQPRQRAAARRIAAQDPPAGGSPREAGRAAPGFAHQARPFCRTADRHAAIRRRATCCSPSPPRRPARCSFVSRVRRPPRRCATRSTPRIPADGYFADVHGSAAYKRHLTYHFAEQIRAELARPGAGA